MGYYSTWEIGVSAGPEDAGLNWGEVFTDGSGGYGFYLEGTHTVRSEDEYKWYSSREDILDISKAHPTATFTITRHGEEAGDAERYQVKNGAVIRTAHQEWVWVDD